MCQLLVGVKIFMPATVPSCASYMLNSRADQVRVPKQCIVQEVPISSMAARGLVALRTVARSAGPARCQPTYLRSGQRRTCHSTSVYPLRLCTLGAPCLQGSLRRYIPERVMSSDFQLIPFLFRASSPQFVHCQFRRVKTNKACGCRDPQGSAWQIDCTGAD